MFRVHESRMEHRISCAEVGSFIGMISVPAQHSPSQLSSLRLEPSAVRLAALAESAPREALPQAVCFSFFLEQPQEWARMRHSAPRSESAICRTGLRTLPQASCPGRSPGPEAPLLENPRRRMADPLSTVFLSAQPGKTGLGCRARGCVLDCGGGRHQGCGGWRH